MRRREDKIITQLQGRTFRESVDLLTYKVRGQLLNYGARQVADLRTKNIVNTDSIAIVLIT